MLPTQGNLEETTLISLKGRENWTAGLFALLHLLCIFQVHLFELTPLHRILSSLLFLFKILPNLKYSHPIFMISNLSTYVTEDQNS